MTSRPDRNQDGIIGVDLPAFLLSKSVRPDPVGAANFLLAVPELRSYRPIVRTIKNPASSAGLSRLYWAALREARLISSQCS